MPNMPEDAHRAAHYGAELEALLQGAPNWAKAAAAAGTGSAAGRVVGDGRGGCHQARD